MMPDISWQNLIEAENGEARGRLAGELLKQGITANVRSLVRIHKWLLSRCVTPEGTLSREDGFASICLLVTIGFTDTQTGHSYLKSLVESPFCQQIDADAMEAMAFEKKYWDGAWIFEKLKHSKTSALSYSCLYALQYKNVRQDFPDLYVELILPRLASQDAYERDLVEVIIDPGMAKG